MTLVWAPGAREPSLVVGGSRRPLRAAQPPAGLDPSREGWWETGDLAPGTDYLLDLGDGGDPVPDPRSAWQPKGIDGPSRTYDHTAFGWTDAGWAGRDLAASVVYELHVGTFTREGTWRAAIGRLDHLVGLGVDLVEVLPANTFSGERGWGYDGVLWWAPHYAYGDPDDLKAFVDACHARGLGVVMDVVYNHLGPAGNHLARFGPWFTDTYSTPWGPALNYDASGSDPVRWHVVDNALMWLRDYHCDGLRLDAVHAIHDESAHHLLRELQEAAEQLPGPARFLIAESDLNDPRVVDAPERRGFGLAAQWSDDYHHALHAAATGERGGYYADFPGGLADVATALEQVFVYAGGYSTHRDRRHGAPVGDLPRTHFLGYAQDHDQVGNRAAGERLSQLVGVEQQQALAALVLLAPFVPMLWMGEEWGAATPWRYFTAHEDEGLAEAVRQGRRSEFAAFGWAPEDVPDPQAPETFERSRLDWSEPARGTHAEVLAWHRELIALRRRERLWEGQTTVHVEGDVLVVERPTLRLDVRLDGGSVRAPDGAEVLLASPSAVVTRR